MGHRVFALCAGVGALLVTWSATACGPGGTASTLAPPADSAPVWPTGPNVLTDGAAAPWVPAAVATELVPTGIELASAPGVVSMAVDGAGAVWLHSPWQFARVDPITGAAQTWDVTDDAVFATMRSMAPSGAGGVWLVEAERVRLFDGRSFVRDLPVPAEFRGGEGRRIHNVIEVGSAVWVSSVAGVARWDGGAWTIVGEDTIGGAAMLTVDSEGSIWAVRQVLLSDGQLEQTIMRLDGDRWTAVDGPGAPPFAEELVADPTGGVLVRFGRDVRRWDGLAWRVLPELPVARALGDPASLNMSVARDGTVWVVGPNGLVRSDPEGPWQPIVQIDEPGLVDVGVAGTEVMVADTAGLLRVDDAQLDRVWAAPPRGLGSPVGGLLVVSGDEVWATADGGVLRYRDGQWRRMLEGLGWLGGSQVAWGGTPARIPTAAV